MGKVDLVRFDSADALALAAAKEWLDAVPANARHSAAFSGGRIAEKFFEVITSEVCQRGRSLAHVHFFWADERCVPPDHLDSNYGLMHTQLLEPLKIPETQVHRIKGELEPVLAAQDASDEFASVVRPILDFVFLGMGEDGHIASIFPGDPIAEAPSEYYRPVVAPKPPPKRITLAMHAMMAARNVWVLASGAGKEEALRQSLGPGLLTPFGHLLKGRPLTRVFTDIPLK